MKNLIKNIKGLILAEALISVAMLIMASVAMTTVLRNSINATTSSKNFLIAENLLIEGVEAVKNIRNSNWLIRPIEKACWLIPDPKNLIPNPPDCENSLVKLDTDYKVAFSDHWFLSEYQENPDSDFQRKIIFDEIDTEIAVFEVSVSWNNGNKDISRKFVLHNYL